MSNFPVEQTRRCVNDREFFAIFDNLVSDADGDPAAGFLLAKIQIQNLPWVNAQHGPSVGDRVIEEVRETLLRNARAFALGQVSPALYGLICRNHADIAGLAASIELDLTRLNHAGRFPFLLDVAVGIVKVLPSESPAAQYWVDRANMALIASSRSGRSETYSPEVMMEARVRDLLGRIQKGSKPLEGISWVYQSVNRASDGAIAGFEALMRWNDPELGAISPELFIRIAEEIGVINVMDRWTLAHVCVDQHSLLRCGGDHVAINVSALTLAFDDGFVDEVRSKVAHHNNGVCNLIIEVTETAAIANRTNLVERIAALRASGVKVAIDDFGKGETNFGQVGQLTFDFLKLDGSLLTLSDRAINRGLIEIAMSLAKLFGATVLLEGVETKADLELARSLGIPLVQGWYFGKAKPLAQWVEDYE